MRRSALTLALLVAALLSGSALMASAAECPAIWSRDIAAIRSTLNRQGSTEPLLVVREEDGAVFDCFNAVPSRRDMKQLDFMLRLIASVEQERPAVKHEHCGLSVAAQGSRQYILLHLPSDAAKFKSAACRAGVARAAKMTRKMLGLDIPLEVLRSTDPRALEPYLKPDPQ